MRWSGFVFAGVLGLAVHYSTVEAAACAGENLVMGAGRAFTAAARSGSPSAFLSAANRFSNTRGIAISALGPYRKNMSKTQESEYVRLAQAYMGQFMAKYASRFNASGMKIVTCKGSIITASANGGRKIIFRVGGGRVEDVNVGGIWLAGQMRSTFTGIIRRNNGDVGALISYLR